MPHLEWLDFNGVAVFTSSLPSQPKPEASLPPAASRWTPEYLHLWRKLLGAAALVFVLCLILNPVHPQDWKGIGTLAVLAVVVSLLPLDMPEANITTSPIVAIVLAAAGLFGAGASILIAVCCAVTDMLIAIPRRSHNRRRQASQMVAAGVLDMGIPAVLYAVLHWLTFQHGGLGRGETPSMWAWGVLSFCTMIAAVINALLTTTLASRFFGKRWDIIWHNNMRWLLPSSLLMSPVAFVTGVLYHEHWWLGVAFIAVPTWAARMAVVYHNRTLAAYKQGVELLGRIMQESHPYTHGHLHRVSHWAKKIAEELNLSAESMQFIEDAAVLHDIGKVAVDDRVLNKVGKLNDEDWAMIRRHPVVGAEIVGRIRYFSKVSLWIRHHHERPDGRGYPSLLSNEDIPIESCIISVVDAYDAMVGGPAKEDKRPYRDPMTPEAAVAELRKHAGTQFHAEVVEVFVAILERESLQQSTGAQAPFAPEHDALWNTAYTTKAADKQTTRTLETEVGSV